MDQYSPERKLSVVRSLLKDYIISDENHLPYVNHRYQTRSKDGGAPFVSYIIGQASASVTGNKGSRKRAISDEEISSSSKQIRSSGTVNTARSPLPDKKKGVVKHQVPVSMIEDVIESISDEEISSSSKQIRSSETVNTARSPLPDKKKGVVELEVNVSMIEDDIESKRVVESKSNALIEAQDQRPIEDNKASDNLGPDVTMEVVKEFDEWFGCTTVPVNVDSSFDNLVAEENRDIRPLFSTAAMSPISKVHHDDHSMNVDNGEEFQSTHPPSII